MEAVWRLLKKLELELPYGPVIRLLGSTHRNVSQDTNGALYTDVHRSTVHDSQALETTQMP
jgi:hypothetical protein